MSSIELLIKKNTCIKQNPRRSVYRGKANSVCRPSSVIKIIKRTNISSLYTLIYGCLEVELQRSVIVNQRISLGHLQLSSESDPHWVLYAFGILSYLRYAQKIPTWFFSMRLTCLSCQTFLSLYVRFALDIPRLGSLCQISLNIQKIFREMSP